MALRNAVKLTNGPSNVRVTTDCPITVLELFRNKFDNPLFNREIIDFKRHVDQSMKLQIIDGQVVVLSIGPNKILGIFNCDLRSKASGKIMYGIVTIHQGNGEAVWRLTRFLSAKVIHAIAKKFNIKSYHLPKSSRKSKDFQQQLVQPHIDDLREGIDSDCAFDHLPCIATVAIEYDRYYIQWVQVIYDKAQCQYRGIGFKYTKKASLAKAYVHVAGVGLFIPNDVLNIIVLYCPNVMVCARNLKIDDIQARNKLLGQESGLIFSDKKFDKYRTLSNDELSLNPDGSFKFAYPPYLLENMN